MSYVPAAVLVVRASALDEVGGFDVGMRCGEDVDLVWRLCRCRLAGTLRTVRGRAPPAAPQLASVLRPASLVRGVGRSARRAPRQGGRPGTDEPVDARRVGPRRRRAPVPRRNGGRGHRRGARAQAARRAGGGVAAPRRPRPPRRRTIVGERRTADVAAIDRPRVRVVTQGPMGHRRRPRPGDAGGWTGPPARRPLVRRRGVAGRVIRRRRLAPLLPDLARWPRRDDVEAGTTA